MTIRVLLVDDQELFRAGISILIEAQPDMTVVGGAADGAHAVELAATLAPDVVLMDLRMPEMDGVEATRRILTDSRRADIAPPVRVIVLTTFDLDERAAVAIRDGASGFLVKDVTPAQLTDAIRTVHAGNAVLSPRDLATLMADGFAGRPSDPPRFRLLTDKEREVFAEVARGRSNTEIAAALFAGESTVKSHVGAILRKLQLRDRVQIVVFAHDHGLVPRSGIDRAQ